MKRFVSIVIIIFVLFACSPSTELEFSNSRIKPEVTATKLNPTATKTRVSDTSTAIPIWATKTPVLTATEIVSREEQELAAFPLSGRGPYWTGNRKFTFVDESRAGREIHVTIRYPALKQTDADGNFITRDAVPDMSAAPYPLILTDGDAGDHLFQSHLVSHGFAMAIIYFPYKEKWDFEVFDRPRDYLFVLDQIASLPLEGLDGVIDSDHVGSAGYSWGGFYSQALSGVRIDPEYYLSFCEQAPAEELELSEWYLEYVCNLAQNWDEFAAYVGDEITASEDGLWQPLTDERIRAVMPMAEYGTWLYGKRGLAMADRPMLIIAPTEDEYIPYAETAYFFEYVGSSERYLISFIGLGHMMVETPKYANRINHFATAFFGYYLQGRDDNAAYFSEDFVSQFDDLAWGVYSDD